MHLKLLSWNINGIRAAIKKDLWTKIKDLSPDIFCFQETKADNEAMANIFPKNGDLEMSDLPDFLNNYNFVYHSCTARKGYSGVITFFRKDLEGFKLIESQIGLGIDKFDEEGRLVITKFQAGEEKIVLLNGYFPQGGRGPHRVEYKIEFYNEVYKLSQKYEKEGYKVIICGDLNTTVTDIDLARPKENRKTTGCLPEEREALDLFIKNEFIDTFRYFFPETPDRYSYWDQITRARERNVGWRIDYFLIQKSLETNLKKADILDQIIGSDHCPVILELDF